MAFSQSDAPRVMTFGGPLPAIARNASRLNAV